MSGKVKTLAQEWADLEAMVLDPAGASIIQRREMKRAFYAGVTVMIQNAQRIADDDVSEDEAVRMLQGLNEEAMSFFRNIITDEAKANV